MPTEMELKEPCSLIESQPSITKVLNGDIEELRVIRTELSNRLLHQHPDLDAAHSSLFQTTELIDPSQPQWKNVSEETENLASFMHPGRSLPVEILKCIFELTVSISGSKVWQAMKLSHVCRFWRAVSLDTPRLWDSIAIAPFKNSDIAWEGWISHVMAIPAEVKIVDITEENLPLIQKWHLSKMPNLQKLRLEVSAEVDVPNMCERLFPIPYPPLKHLSLAVRTPGYAQIAARLREAEFITNFPGLVSLGLSGIVPPYFGPPTSRSLVTLSLQYVHGLDFHSVIQHLPQLETLYISSASFATPKGPTDVTSKIRCLKLWNTLLFEKPWARNLRFPCLSSLHYGDNSTDSMMAFLMAHPHLQTLGFAAQEEDLAQCALFVPGLTHLGVGLPFLDFTSLAGSGLAGIPFACLRRLTFFGWPSLDAESFETIVRVRCLPTTHPKSLLKHPNQPLEELRVVLFDGMWETEPWAFSELAREAMKKVVPYEGHDGWYCVSMHWDT